MSNLKVFKFGWVDEYEEDEMIAEVYGFTLSDAVAALDIDPEVRKTLKVLSVEPYAQPRPGVIKFIGTVDDYVDYVDEVG